MNECPILAAQEYAAPSVFQPQALLREARRQRHLPVIDVPDVCVLDPDGDLVRRLRQAGRATRHAGWACYHAELICSEIAGLGQVGIVGCAVGAPFAVLVAEQLFAAGCRLLISVASAGRIADGGPPPYFVLIERALRDEGTGDHDLPPARFVQAPDAALLDRVRAAVGRLDGIGLRSGASWTTDAPYRETQAAIDAARDAGVLAVETEAAALYAFATAAGRQVVCFAHVTNATAPADGTAATLAVIAATALAAGPGEDVRTHWDTVYRTKAADRVSWHQQRPLQSLRMIGEVAGDRQAAIVDIGAGAGNLVDALLDAGYGDLTVLDISQAALDLARARLGPRAEAVTWLARDITAWMPPAGRFALWHDRAVFHFLIDENARRGYLRALDEGLRPGGHLILATFAPSGPERCSGLPVQRYSAETLQRTLGPRYRLLRAETATHTTPGGTKQDFTWTVFRKADR